MFPPLVESYGPVRDGPDAVGKFAGMPPLPLKTGMPLGMPLLPPAGP